MVRRYSDSEMNDFKAFYETHGVVRLPGLVEPEWVAKIQAEIDHAITRADEERRPDEALSFGKAPGRMTIRHQWRENPVVRDFLLRSALAEPIARIVGAHQLRFWFDLTFIHDGADHGETGVGTGWHHDIAAFNFKGEQLPSLWMAMTPCNAERSRLMFIDRSHRTAPGFYRTPDAQAKFDADPSRPADGMLTIPDFDRLVAEGKETIVTWDCEPGDGIIIHPFTVHGASGNKGKAGAGRRVAITTRWFGDDVRFYPTHAVMGQQVPGVKENPILVGGRPDGPYFPLVYTDDPAKAEAA